MPSKANILGKRQRRAEKEFVVPNGWHPSKGFVTQTVHTSKCDFCTRHVTDGNPAKQCCCGVNICWFCEQARGGPELGLEHGCCFRTGQLRITRPTTSRGTHSSEPRSSGSTASNIEASNRDEPGVRPFPADSSGQEPATERLPLPSRAFCPSKLGRHFRNESNQPSLSNDEEQRSDFQISGGQARANDDLLVVEGASEQDAEQRKERSENEQINRGIQSPVSQEVSESDLYDSVPGPIDQIQPESILHGQDISTSAPSRAIAKGRSSPGYSASYHYHLDQEAYLAAEVLMSLSQQAFEERVQRLAASLSRYREAPDVIGLYLLRCLGPLQPGASQSQTPHDQYNDMEKAVFGRVPTRFREPSFILSKLVGPDLSCWEVVNLIIERIISIRSGRTVTPHPRSVLNLVNVDTSTPDSEHYRGHESANGHQTSREDRRRAIMAWMAAASTANPPSQSSEPGFYRSQPPVAQNFPPENYIFQQSNGIQWGFWWGPQSSR